MEALQQFTDENNYQLPEIKIMFMYGKYEIVNCVFIFVGRHRVNTYGTGSLDKTIQEAATNMLKKLRGD